VSELAWIDASHATLGAGGSLLLGALLDAGVPTGVIADAVDKVAPGQVRLEEDRVTRGGAAATRCRVHLSEHLPHRSWREVELLLAEAGLHEDVRSLAHDVLARVAEAEATAEGTSAGEAPLREAGAADRVAEVVGVCAAMVHLGVRHVVVRPTAGVDPAFATTSQAALLATLADDWGDQPPMVVTREGLGVGATDAGTVRLVVGDR
jgi:uncharacterized protein (DUF111 family)